MRARALQILKDGQLFRHFLLSWLIATCVEYLLLPADITTMEGLQGLAAMSFGRLIAITLILGIALTVVNLFVCTNKYERWAIFGVFSLLAVITAAHNFTIAFAVFLGLLIFGFAVYALWGYDHQNQQPVQPAPKKQKTHWGWYIAVSLLALGFFITVSVWTVLRVKTFSTPAFDFGLFAQMFHNMKETGLPMTTVERDGLLSHFAVHVSPIYYLMLPFYCLYPEPETLQVLQAAVLASSVIPLWLLCKKHGLSPFSRTLLCAIMLFLPAVSGGTSYDLHENCFLLPLILWLMYGIDRRSIPITAIAAVLTLGVKEDAAVYVAVAGLYLAVRSLIGFRKDKLRDLITGILLLAGAVAYFFCVTGYLESHGDGVMTYRYKNFMYDGSDSLFTVVKAILLCPMKMLYECVDPEKLPYIGMTIAPLLGMPLITRKYDRYILLIPYILLNLMSDYQYQHDVMFQYNFGSTAFLMYLTAVNLADLHLLQIRITGLIVALIVSAVMFFSVIVPEVDGYVQLYNKYFGYYSQLEEALDRVPEDASVTAHTFYITHYSEREVLYDIRYCSTENLLSTDYVVLKINNKTEHKRFKGASEDGFENLVALLEENGYQKYYQHGSVFVIYEKQ